MNLQHNAKRVIVALASLAGVVGTGWCQTKEPSNMQVSIWASSCMACHGPDGRAEGTGLGIGGRPADDLLGKLLGYKTGNLRATIMHQHTKGYSDDELKRIAEYFSSLK
jgi:cytochrome c553